MSARGAGRHFFWFGNPPRLRRSDAVRVEEQDQDDD